MKEFYFIYYLVLFGIYTLLPVVFWSLSRFPRKEESRVTYYRKELRGHLMVSLVLSAIVLSFLPLIVTLTEETEGITQVVNGLFVVLDIALAGFFIWIGVMQAGANRRMLREEQEKQKKESDQE